MTKIVPTFALVFAVITSASLSSAQVKGKDRNIVKQMLKGDLYLRNNVPCRYTSGRWGGIGAEVVTEVSPEGVDWDRNLQAIDEEREKKKRKGVDTIYWGFGPNDMIRYGEVSFEGETIELWAEGAEPKDTEIYIHFVGIKTVDDFKKAYDHILSKKSYQDEHPEWPEDIRKAIAERKVIKGMTKTQAFASVGTPIGIDTSEEDGKKIETWFPRQETGAAGGYGKVMGTATGFPLSLRFVDGILTSIVQSPRQPT